MIDQEKVHLIQLDHEIKRLQGVNDELLAACRMGLGYIIHGRFHSQQVFEEVKDQLEEAIDHAEWVKEDLESK